MLGTSFLARPSSRSSLAQKQTRIKTMMLRSQMRQRVNAGQRLRYDQRGSFACANMLIKMRFDILFFGYGLAPPARRLRRDAMEIR